jgi:hypothetical protein
MELTSEFSEQMLEQAMSGKEKLLIEYVVENPIFVLKKVFYASEDLFITEELNYWLIIGLSSDLYAYDDWGTRLPLVYFYDQLLLLVEALYTLYLRNKDSFDKEAKVRPYKINLLSKEQLVNLKQVIVAFFNRFSIAYIIRELDDWFVAGLTYPASLPDQIYGPYHIYRIYQNVLCLIKSAERLIQKDYPNTINWMEQNN